MKKFRSSGGQKGREERAMKEKRFSSSHSATPTKKREGLEGKKANSLSISQLKGADHLLSGGKTAILLLLSYSL
ncbi:unnamed protein product [Prunus armeniaca]|nr:unnamed protein product [Prunus armeniaca]CAB4304533.1 unnamed protein product [Prunus armeniaca]